MRIMLKSLAVVLAVSTTCSASDKIQVVTTLPNFKSIVEEVGGDQVEVVSIAKGVQDAHFIDPKPSFMVTLRDADLLFINGMQLELGYVPPLVQGSRNPRIQLGAAGLIDLSRDVARIEVPAEGTTRAEGDVHPLGNPHYMVDPWNGRVVAAQIAEALSQVRPEAKAGFEERLKAFQAKLDAAMFGQALVDEVGASKLWRESGNGSLLEFIDHEKLVDKVGGWVGNMWPAHGKKIVTYHKQLSYFANRFGVVVAECIEPKPGIPPSAAHLAALVEFIPKNEVKAIVRFPYNESSSVDLLAQKTGVRCVVCPCEVGGAEGADDYIKVMDQLTKSVGDACK